MAKKRKESHLTIDSIPSDSHFEFGILSKVVVTFIILSLVPMGLLGLISLEGMDSIGNTSVERSTEALETEANNSLMQFSEDKAAQIDLIFQHYESVLNTTANYAEKIWVNPRNFTARPSYYHDATLSEEPPGFQFSEKYGYNVSFDVSCYKLADWAFGALKEEYLAGNETPSFRENANANVSDSIENGAKLEELLILQFKENPQLSLIYFGTRTGVHRSYPWHTYTNRSYDPTMRGWYNRSMAEPDQVVWGNPYIDASGQGLVITGSRSVRNRSTPDNELVGVVGIDIKITTIKDEILGFSVYNTGYSFLIDGEGNTIAHKDLSPAQGQDWTKDDLKNPIITFEGPEFNETMNRMIQGESDVDVIKRENSSFFVGYHPIPSTGFSFAVVADSEEVLRAVIETEETISDKQDSTMNTIFTLIGAAVIFVLVVGLLLARKIVNPLKHLTQTALEVSEGELDQTIHVLSKDEIGKLAKAFEKMVAALKKANIMIAREEHKGSDLSEISSQESVRMKARELLGVEASGTRETETLRQIPGSPVSPGTSGSSPFQAPQETLPVFAPTAPPAPPKPAPTYTSRYFTPEKEKDATGKEKEVPGKEEERDEDEPSIIHEDSLEESEGTSGQGSFPQYFTPSQETKGPQYFAPPPHVETAQDTKTPDDVALNLGSERERTETETAPTMPSPFTPSQPSPPPPPPPPLPLMPDEAAWEEEEDDVISIDEGLLEDSEEDFGEAMSEDEEKGTGEESAKSGDPPGQNFGFNLGGESVKTGDDKLHVPFEDSGDHGKRDHEREGKKGDNS